MTAKNYLEIMKNLIAGRNLLIKKEYSRGEKLVSIEKKNYGRAMTLETVDETTGYKEEIVKKIDNKIKLLSTLERVLDEFKGEPVFVL